MAMTHAVGLIEAERDALSTLGGALADVDGVAEAYSVTGEWDFVAIVRLAHHEQLADVVTARRSGVCSRRAGTPRRGSRARARSGERSRWWRCWRRSG
jgi:DNA-binding Lrp family transcriptional regulator